MSKQNKTQFVPVRMTPDELEALQQLADERCCSVGAVMRWAVRVAIMGERKDIAMQNATIHANRVAK